MKGEERIIICFYVKAFEDLWSNPRHSHEIFNSVIDFDFVEGTYYFFE